MTDAAINRADPGRAAALAPALFAATVFFSAALVFMVEPMVAKLVLPTLGGSPAVWNTSLAFFQVALLVGYAYAHLLQKIASVRIQTVVHGGVLIASALVLPLNISKALGEPGPHDPALWLLGVLSLSIGAPFAALSATAPLVQSWYGRVRAGHPDAANPYVLYASSNLGSLLALLAYPVVIEPGLRLRTQTLGWSGGYVAFGVLIGAVALSVWRTARPRPAPAATPDAATPETVVSWKTRLIWVALAAAPSSLMLGITTYISTDIASAPFLWVAPLAIYLLTFIIAFQAKPLISRENALVFQAAALIGCLLTFNLAIPQYLLQLGLHLVGFFLTALVCHQALAARRPAPAKLTEFYLLMSLGGVVGGVFNALIAPVIFKTVVEYPLVLLAVGLARPWGRRWPTRRQWVLFAAGLAAAGGAVLLGRSMSLNLAVKLLLAVTMVAAFLLRDRAPLFLLLCLTLVGGARSLSPHEYLIRSDRSFFGVLRVTRFPIKSFGEARLLAHGTTLHGAELIDPQNRCRPLVYYARTTPIGQVFRAMQAQRPGIRIGAIGMGTGTVATYTRPSDSLRFFEIDPLVVKMATDPRLFSYIHGCAQGRIDHVLGDARLTLGHEPIDQFDILLVDAFSSDSVPAHLLTVEAMRGYLAHIRPDGVIIMHLSNRNLELMQPVSAAAIAAGGAALQQAYRPPIGSIDKIDTGEDAVIIARNPAALAIWRADPRWKPANPHGVRTWTDDYTNLFGALIRGIGHAERETRSN